MGAYAETPAPPKGTAMTASTSEPKCPSSTSSPVDRPHGPRTELEKMLAGELYLIDDPELRAMRRRCYELTDALNATTNADHETRRAILRELLGGVGERVNVKSSFRCDYGCNIHLGDDVFINVDCVILDCARVEIGSGTLIGPQVGIYAVTHPVDAAERACGREWGEPVTIGSNCWIGGHATILPGVTLGDNVIIAAGAVVTRSFPANVMVAGVPARVVREL